MSHSCMQHNGDPAYCDACREEYERELHERRAEERAHEDAMILEETELQAIEARCDAATPGDWRPCHHWSVDAPCECGKHRGYIFADGLVVCQMGSIDLYEGEAVQCNPSADQEQMKKDARFIAHAREDVPKLLAALREARAVADAITDAPLGKLLAKITTERDALRAEVERLKHGDGRWGCATAGCDADATQIVGHCYAHAGGMARKLAEAKALLLIALQALDSTPADWPSRRKIEAWLEKHR